MRRILATTRTPLHRVLGWAGLVVVFATLFFSDPVQAGEWERVYLRHVRARLRASPLSPPRQSEGVLTLSLEECLRRAQLHYGKIRAEDEGIYAAEAQLKEAKARFWPVFEYEYRTAPVPRNVGMALESFFSGDITWLHTMKLHVGVPLYTFGKLPALQKLAQQGVSAALFKKGQESASTATHIRKLYYGLQLGEDLAGVFIDAIDKITDRLAQAELSSEDWADDEETPASTASVKGAAPSGAAGGGRKAPWGPRPFTGGRREPPEINNALSPIDQLQLQLFRGELEKRLAEVRKKQRLALAALRIHIDVPDETRMTLTRRHLEPRVRSLTSLHQYIAQALAQRPEAQLVDVGLEAKRLEYLLERKKYYPDVGVGAFFEAGRTLQSVTGFANTDDFTNPFHFLRAGLGLQVQGKFDPHGASARVRKKKHEYYKVKIQRETAHRGIALEVREAYLDAQMAREQMTRADERSNAAQRMVFLTKNNLDLGIGDRDEYTEALQMVLLTRGEYFGAIFDYQLALAQLDEKIGAWSHEEESFTTTDRP